jgi:hypothetical protein
VKKVVLIKDKERMHHGAIIGGFIVVRVITVLLLRLVSEVIVFLFLFIVLVIIMPLTSLL